MVIFYSKRVSFERMNYEFYDCRGTLISGINIERLQTSNKIIGRIDYLKMHCGDQVYPICWN